MIEDPLLAYLMEIAVEPEANGIILMGGFGMRIKQQHLRSNQKITLLPDAPEARATQDLDFVLRMQLWLDTAKGKAFGEMLKRLGYETMQYSWEFKKPVSAEKERHVIIDFHAREPHENEPIKVKSKKQVPQVGKEMGTGISGRKTSEAFAIDELPISVNIEDGMRSASVLVPHPYAWLNIKTRAAHDWLLERDGNIPPKPTSEGRVSRRLKHVFDVYVLTAMLTEEEQDQAIKLARQYSDHAEARRSRDQALELYGSSDSPGVVAARAYARQSGMNDIEYELFWEALSTSLGIG